MNKDVIYKIVVAITTCIVAIAAALCLPSCKAQRIYCTQCTAITRGDSVAITSNVVETYVGAKKSSL